MFFYQYLFLLKNQERSDLCFDSELSWWPSSLCGELFGGFSWRFIAAQGASDSAGLFWSQVNWLVLFAFVEFAQVFFLCLIDYGKYTCNRFANFTAKIFERKKTCWDWWIKSNLKLFLLFSGSIFMAKLIVQSYRSFFLN